MLTIMFFIGCAGYAAYKKHLEPVSRDLKVAQYLDFNGYPKPEAERLIEKYQFGVLGNNDTEKVLLLGDSHSEQYRNTFASIYKNHTIVNKKLPELMYSIDYLGHSDLLSSIVADFWRYGWEVHG